MANTTTLQNETDWKNASANAMDQERSGWNAADGWTSKKAIHVQIGLYYTLIVAGVGLLGNIATVLVMKLTKGPKTMKLILICMAVSDGITLLANIPRAVFKRITATVIFKTSILFCNIDMFFVFSFPAISNWLIVLLSVERALAVILPLHLKLIVTTTKVKIVVGILTLIYFAWASFVSLYAFDVNEIFDENGNVVTTACLLANAVKFVQITMGLVSTCVPFFVVVSSNLIISGKIIWQKRQAQRTLGRASDSNESKLIVTTFAVSLAFLFLSTPTLLYFTIGEKILGHRIYLDYDNPYKIAVDCMYLTNFAINFFLYVAFTKSFRTSAKVLVGSIKLSLPRWHSGGTSQSSSIQTI